MLFVPSGPCVGPPAAAPSGATSNAAAAAAVATPIQASASKPNVGPRSQFGHKKQLVSSTLSLEFPSRRNRSVTSQPAMASNVSSGALSASDNYPFRNLSKRNAISQAAYTKRLSRGQAAATTVVRQLAQQQSRVSHFGHTKPVGPGRIASGSRLGGRPGSAPARSSGGSGSGASGGGDVGKPRRGAHGGGGTEILSALSRLDAAAQHSSPLAKEQRLAISRQLLQLVIERDETYGAVLLRVQQEIDNHFNQAGRTGSGMGQRTTAASKRFGALKRDYDNLSREFHDLRSRHDQVKR
eukprot:SAG11_NODE_2798_length_2958_cov_2.445261_1_plen_297_part_00